MGKVFQLQVNVINGEVKEFPETFFFRCNEVVPIGQTIIRYFNDDMCSVAKKTFYLRYGSDLFGTDQFSTSDQFWRFTNCYPNITFLNLNGCTVQFNGNNILIS